MTYLITYALNLFDLFCTYRLYTLYGLSIEGNPIGRYLLSTNLAIPFKAIGIGAALIALYAGVKRYPRWRWISWVVLGVYAGLAVWHVILIFVLKGADSLWL